MKYLILTLFVFFQDSLTTTDIPLTEPAEVQISTKQGVALPADSAFVLYSGIGPYDLQSRVERLSENLEQLKERKLDLSKLLRQPHEVADDILCDGLLIMSVNDTDAALLGLSRQGAVEYYMSLIRGYHGRQESPKLEIKSLLVNIGIAVLIVVLFAIGLRYFNRLFRFIYQKIRAQKGGILKGVHVKDYELLTQEKAVVFVIYAAKILRIALLVLIVYLLLPILFSLFPWTQDIATTLFGYVLDPVKSLGSKAIGFIPNLLTIIVIWLATRYVLKLLRFFKDEVAKGRLDLPGFYPEWAKPTFNIVRIFVIALAFIGIWPLLPMSDSDIFKGVSTFIGLLVALGGAGAISNVIAGLVITYMRSFKIGDRVKIGDVMGDVKEKSLLNTRIKTIKNEIITIPNSQMLNSHTINYTTANDEEGLILHTTITLGYDVPWRTAHKVLIEAALATEFVKKLPKPYVLQTALNDFYVSYQLNARTREIHKMALIYSEMHKNIQDKCNEAGIEILSPHYAAQRDGNHSTIPEEHLPKDYQAPWFRLKTE